VCFGKDLPLTTVVPLGNKMLSKETENDLETLLSMDIKLRLLDAEGVDIPQDPPSVPLDPPNYDFCYELK
jgi:engulfment/cell motility protein 1